jgi:DNA polymerase phi
MGFIYEWAKADEKRITTVILSMQYCSNGKFDSLTRTQTVKQLMNMLKSEEVSVLLYGKLIQLFGAKEMSYLNVVRLQLNNVESEHELHDLNESKKPKIEGEKPRALQKHWVLDQLCAFVKQSKGEVGAQLQKEFVKFLTVNALFIGSPGMKCKIEELGEEASFPLTSLSEEMRNACLARLQGVLMDVTLVASVARDGKINPEDGPVKRASDYRDIRFYFLELCDRLEQIQGVTRVQPISEDDRDAIKALRSCISQLFAAVRCAVLDLQQLVSVNLCNKLMVPFFFTGEEM